MVEQLKMDGLLEGLAQKDVLWFIHANFSLPSAWNTAFRRRITFVLAITKLVISFAPLKDYLRQEGRQEVCSHPTNKLCMSVLIVFQVYDVSAGQREHQYSVKEGVVQLWGTSFQLWLYL